MCNKGGVILDPSQNHCMDIENTYVIVLTTVIIFRL